MEFDTVKIRQQIAAYGLFDKLMERMQIVRPGRGVKRSTIYKAYSIGPTTVVLRLILENAQAVIDEHLEKITEPVAA